MKAPPNTSPKKQIPSSRRLENLDQAKSEDGLQHNHGSCLWPPPFLPLSDLPNNVLRDTTQKANT